MELFFFFSDAAHRVHPLAGQGVNLGFGDVEHLCRILKKYRDNGARIGDLNIQQLRIN